MRKLKVLLFGVIILLIGGSFYFSRHNSTTQILQNKISPTTSKIFPSPKSMQTYCTSQDLQAIVNLSPGAGNVYGTFTLKNISHHTCQILGNEFILATYDTSVVKNITITHVGNVQQQPFTFSPGRTLYSQVHYPNGPQCQSVGLHATPVTFTYKISPTSIVTFSSGSQNIPQVVQTCMSPTDMTTIQIWNMSSQPRTP